MDREYYFNQWPLGTEVYLPLECVIARVVAHVESTWLGKGGPWYGLLSVPVIPDKWDGLLPYTPDDPAARDKTVIAGEMPAQFDIHCLNGGGRPEIVKLTEFKIALTHRNLTVLTHPYGWLACMEDPGDSSVGVPGGDLYLGTGVYYADGYPELPGVYTSESGEIERGDSPWLPKVFWHIERTLEMQCEEQDVDVA